jgi:hypothetical protein
MAKMWSAEVVGIPPLASLATGTVMLVAVLLASSATEVKYTSTPTDMSGVPDGLSR